MDSYSGSGNLSGGGERSHGNTVTSTNSVLSGVRMPGMAPSGMGMLLAGQSTIGKQACRAAASEIDVEVDDRRVGGPMKLPRTDAFPCPDLKMHVATAIDQHQHQHHHYIVRNSGGSSSSTGCLMSEGRLAVAPTNSNASDGILFPHDGSGSGSGSGSIVSEGRLLRSDSVLSAAGARPGLPFQVYHYKPAGMPLSLSSMAGMGVGREMGMGMGMGMGMLTAVRPPFSPSQWQELEHQALIFKYMMAGVPVPPDLLLPIRKSLLSFTAGSHQHHPGLTPWSSFQIGYGGNVDPEPGRCRRTDGKKWRCSRDVVPDQKYCERHMHRGRHRGSRKPVEGQTATATATATPVTSQTSTNSTAGASSALSLAAVRTGTNLPPPISINSQCHRQQQQASDQNQSVPKNMSVGMSFGGNGNQFHQYQLLVGAGASGTAHKDYRYVNGIKAEDMDEHILFSETPGSTGASHPWRSMAASKATGATPFSQVKMNSNGSLLNYNSTSPQLRSIVGEELGLMSEGSQASNFQTNPGPSQQQYSFMGTVREQEGGQPLRHFFDEWPRVRARDPWSSDVVDLEEEERSKRSSSATQLSISIPMASSDFSATNSTSSPRGKLSLSPLKLSMSRDGNGNKDDDPPSVDPVETGLAVGMNMNLNVEDRHRQHQHQDHHHPQSNWIPSAWENPMGMLGPLAEVLQSSTTTPRGNNNPGLNLMNDIAWNNNNNNKSVGSPSRDSHSQSPPSCIASSPTERGGTAGRVMATSN